MLIIPGESLSIVKDNWDIFFGILDPSITLLTAGFIIYFTFLQIKINKRLKELQDYVAISITPIVNNNSYNLQVKNNYA